MIALLRKFFVPAKPAPSNDAEAFPVLPVAPVTVEVEREEKPRFKRIYRGTLDARASIKIVARTSWGDRMYDGELTQPNGRWVLFDPHRVADKILDPNLVPLVESAVRVILGMDRAFMATRPDTFVDSGGDTWKRVA